MPQLCRTGAPMQCSFGAAPSVLNVLPEKRTTAVGPPAATIVDMIPLVNIPPFGVCSSPANPAVAAATAAAFGVLTPMPCVPVPVGPWVPGSPTVLIGKILALNNTCKLFCAWGGVIQFVNAGQLTVNVP